MRGFGAASSVALLFILSSTFAFGETWTYQLKVIDSSQIDRIPDQAFEDLPQLEAFTKIETLTIDFQENSEWLYTAEIKACSMTCQKPVHEIEPTKIEDKTATFDYPVSSHEFRVVNAFYHANKTLAYFKKLGIQPKRLPLLVQVDMISKLGVLKQNFVNGAYYLPSDNTLNLAPSRDQKIFDSDKTKKYLASAYDPTVISHELTHFIFWELVGERASQIRGLDEGLADFLAMQVHGISSFGAVFNKGSSLRATHGDLQYHPAMEEHELGEVMLQLFNSLQLSNIEGDISPRLIKSVQCAASELVASIYGFSLCYLAQVSTDLGDAEFLSQLKIFRSRYIFPEVLIHAPKELSNFEGDRLSLHYRMLRKSTDEESKRDVEIFYLGNEADVFEWYGLREVDLVTKRELRLIVLINYLTTDIVSVYTVDGVKLDPENITKYPELFKSAQRFKHFYTTERFPSSHPEGMEADTCKVGKLDLDCFTFEMSWLKKLKLNTSLGQKGLTAKYKKYKIEKLQKADALLRPFSTIKYEIDVTFGSGKEARRVEESKELLNIERKDIKYFLIP